MKVLVIDNYDSFAYNLVQYLGELDAEVEVVRNDRATVEELLARGYERCVISPGPCTPDEAGISLQAARRMPEAGVPTLGVCLGHQALAQAFGGRVHLHPPVHGKATTVEHDGLTIFAGLPSPLTVGRYHSLVVAPELPGCLMQSAHGGGVLMGVRHRQLPAEGVQFHPESVLTEQGRQLLANFLDQRIFDRRFSGSDSPGSDSDGGSPAIDSRASHSDAGSCASGSDSRATDSRASGSDAGSCASGSDAGSRAVAEAR